MRIFAIKDDTLPSDTILGYLVYYEKPKAFYIELPYNADVWDTPPILSSFVKKGQYSINSYWSRIWVEQRIIPRERQNIGQILRENDMNEYDEFTLLTLADGRCAQDDCYIEEIIADKIPEILLSRWEKKVEDVVPLDRPRMLVFFRNSDVKIINIKDIPDYTSTCEPYLASDKRFVNVEVQPDGYGICWSEQAVISDKMLYDYGTPVPLSLDDFITFVRNRVINTAEACAILDCSRQNIDDLVKRKKLHPIRTDAKAKLFLKNEVMQRRKQ